MIDKQESLIDIDTITRLINLITDPCLFINLSNPQYNNPNIAFEKLTGFSQTDTTSRPIKELSPQLSTMLLLDEDLELPITNIQGILHTKSGDSIVVNIDIHNLSMGQCLVRFRPVLQKKTESLNNEHLQQVTELISILIQKEIDHSHLSKLCHVVNKLLAFGSTNVYLTTDNNKVFNLIAYSGERLNLSSLEITSDVYNTPNYWDKQVLPPSEELRSIFSTQEYNHIVTAPIIIHGNIAGLILGASKENEVAQNTIQLLTLLANAISRSTASPSPIKQKVEYQIGNQRDTNLILDYIQDGIIILSHELRVMDMNPAAQEYLGYSLDEAHNKPIDTILVGSEILINALMLALQGAATHDMPNVHLHRRDGTLFPAQIKVYPVVQNESEYSVLVILRDLSEIEKIDEHARKLEERAWLGKLTAMFAHEVRNPINAIRTGLQVLEQGENMNEDDLETIKQLIKECDNLNHLMEATLSYSRLGGYKFEKLDLPDLLQNIINKWQIKLIRANVLAKINAGPDVPYVRGDKRALTQVFENLIANAVQVMEKSGGGALSIYIELNQKKTSHKEVSIRISDTGPGIPDSIIEKIFEPFFTTKEDGTGLGLAITKQIIVAHKGSISAKSLTGGTVFEINLPAWSE